MKHLQGSYIKMDKIKLSKQEFEEMYEVIEGDTPQPDLDKLKEQQPEFLTQEETEIEDKYLEDIAEDSEVEMY